MKVCFISYEYPPNIIGGAGTYAKFLVDGLKNSGIKVNVISNGTRNDKDKEIFRISTNNMPY